MAARLAVKKTYKLYIGGAFPRGESGRTLRVQDPKGAFVANLSLASRKDLRDAVRAARKAQAGWAARTAFNRGQILYRMAEMLEGRREGFERLLAEHAGREPAAASAEVSAAIDRLVWYAGWADKFAQVFGTVNPVAAPFFNFTTPEAAGVVVIVAPRNAPLVGLVSALAPVIVAGNACVAVVDGDAPHIAIELAEVLATSDLPSGVVNILTGARTELLPHIATHEDIDAVAAYGLTPAERQALEQGAAESVKRVKSFDDLDAAAWLTDAAQSPYRILPFVEFRTAWHPTAG